MPTQTQQRGFTIIELMVTLSILGLMLFLVNELFNNTSRAVTLSVQASKTISISRSTNEQLTSDGDAMLGPGSARGEGYIVIIQQRIPDVTMIDPQTLGEVTVDEIRSDQIVFIRSASGLRSMTPSGPNNYGTNTIGQGGGARAKVYYGHAQRTNPDGTTRTGTDTAIGLANAGPDRIGRDLILARQAMLFNPPALDTTTDVYANTAYYLSDVQGLGGAGAPGSPQAHMGLTDVTAQTYSALVTQLTNGAEDAFAGATDNDDYLATTYLGSRLQVNPAPNAADTNYASWAIAQGHPILAQSCSEIIIDFAADLNGDGLIDTQFGGQGVAGAPIFWYDALRQPALGNGTAGTWVQQTQPNPIPGDPPLNIPPQPQNEINPDTQAFIFRVDDDRSFNAAGGTLGVQGAAHSYWPYLIRIRYRLHDTRGRLTSNEPSALRDGLDNNGDGTPDDPSEDRLAGRWFERIISVPRP